MPAVPPDPAPGAGAGPGAGPRADVLVVGAGPVGLMLAGELRLAGAAVVLVDRLPAPMTQSRAAQLNTRTAEILHARGVDELLAEARPEPRSHFGGLGFELSHLDSPYAGNWKVPQYRTEAALARRALALGVEPRRPYDLIALDSPADSPAGSADAGAHVVATVVGPSGPVRLRARFVVGCDGEESTVRRLGGFDFPASAPTRELLRADVRGIDIAERRFERRPGGFAVADARDGVTRVMVHEHGRTVTRRTTAPTFAEVAQRWFAVTGEDIRHGTPVWVDAFDNSHGQVTGYRRGRVLLAGDAAHRHLPIGGQALNLGLQDAVNLGWKLGAAARGDAPAGLLDTYHDERHPVGARILRAVVAQEDLLLGGPAIDPLRAVLADLLAEPTARAQLAGLTSGVDVRYGDDPDPLVGRRLPALDLGGRSTDELLRSGRGLLLTPDAADPSRPRHPRVRAVSWPEHILVRPDGHVAWRGTGRGTPAGLPAALRRWFGPAATDVNHPISPRPDEELAPS